jgi:hypothetical protein
LKPTPEKKTTRREESTTAVIEYLDFARRHRFGDWMTGYKGGAPSMDGHRARDEGTARFAWAIPDEEALTLLLALGPLIELGAGCGYWTFLLRERGGDVVAYERNPPLDDRHSNGYCKETNRGGGAPDVIGRVWTPVLKGRVKPIRAHPDRTLFLCWPLYGDRFAAVALQAYRGARFAYIGEGASGCTGDDDFHALLAHEWEDEIFHRLHQWWGLHDNLTIYRRKESPAP